MSVKNIEGHFIASGIKLAIVVARFNDFINNKLVEGALDTYVRHGGKEQDITIVKVPGAFEIPLACAKLASGSAYEGIVALGTVIRGGTPHFDYVAAEVSKGIAQVSLKSNIPIGFGVLTTDNIEQAIERAGTKAGNKGAEAMLSVIETVDLFKKLSTGLFILID